jgi:hypothetical protein
VKKSLTLYVIIFFAIVQIASSTLHSNGIAGYNNSPEEITCTNCHVTYPINSSGGSVLINVQNCNNNNYIPGQTYIVNIKIIRAGLNLFGFSFEALDSTGSNGGNITLINPGTTILINALVNGNNRTNVTHYGGVLNTDSCTFSFNWTAPTTNIGKITFYTAALASNGDGSSYGDYVYTSFQELNPDSGTLVVNAAALESRISIYPNPTNDQFYIETNNTIMLTVDLYDVNGKQVLKDNYRNKSNIDLTTLREGIYILSIRTSEGFFNKKLVLLH